MSSARPMRDGMHLKNQIGPGGTASSMCPMRSRRTRASVTSTPQRSQTTPRCLMRLYLPQEHSQSLTGPKMRSQKSPPFSGLNERELMVVGFLISPFDHERTASGEATEMATYST